MRSSASNRAVQDYGCLPLLFLCKCPFSPFSVQKRRSVTGKHFLSSCPAGSDRRNKIPCSGGSVNEGCGVRAPDGGVRDTMNLCRDFFQE